MEVFAFPVSTLVPFRVAHPTPGQQPRNQCTRGRDHRPASLLSLLGEHENMAQEPQGPPSFLGHWKEKRGRKGQTEEGEGEYGKEIEKEEEHTDTDGKSSL